MPKYDGTGPQGKGPMTGRGEGYCVLRLPDTDQAPYGFAGIQGTPVSLRTPADRRTGDFWFHRWVESVPWLRWVYAYRRGRHWGRRRTCHSNRITG
jgi:hypothetical protein